MESGEELPHASNRTDAVDELGSGALVCRGSATTRSVVARLLASLTFVARRCGRSYAGVLRAAVAGAEAGGSALKSRVSIRGRAQRRPGFASPPCGVGGDTDHGKR